MKTLKFYGNKDIRIEEVEEPAVVSGSVKIEVEWGGICGSDMRYYFNPTENPMTLGHEFCGTVIDIGEGVTTIKVGDRVVVNPIITCGNCYNCRNGSYNLCDTLGFIGYSDRGGFCELVVVEEKHLHKLPDNVSFEEGSLVEPLSVVMHAVRRSDFKTGDEVAIFGAGPIGLLLTSILKASGASKIMVVEISEQRRDQALKLGATHVFDPNKVDVISEIKALTNGGTPIAFEVAGVQSTFSSALSSIRSGGELMIIAQWKKDVSFNPSLAVKTEKKINTSMCYTNEFPLVIDWLSKGIIKLDGIITKKIHLDDAKEEGFETYAMDNTQFKILITPKYSNLDV